MNPWVKCPSASRGVRPVPVGERAADGVRLFRCPCCAWTFPTMMDSPGLPPHWLNRESGDVMVRPPDIVDLR